MAVSQSSPGAPALIIEKGGKYYANVTAQCLFGEADSLRI
jgi:hypothetical protein